MFWLRSGESLSFPWLSCHLQSSPDLLLVCHWNNLSTLISSSFWGQHSHNFVFSPVSEASFFRLRGPFCRAKFVFSLKCGQHRQDVRARPESAAGESRRNVYFRGGKVPAQWCHILLVTTYSQQHYTPHGSHSVVITSSYNNYNTISDIDLFLSLDLFWLLPSPWLWW